MKTSRRALRERLLFLISLILPQSSDRARKLYIYIVAIAKNMTDAASHRRRMERMMTPGPWLIPKEAGNKVVNHIWDDMVLIYTKGTA
jgi:hypothetical protein